MYRTFYVPYYWLHYWPLCIIKLIDRFGRWLYGGKVPPGWWQLQHEVSK